MKSLWDLPLLRIGLAAYTVLCPVDVWADAANAMATQSLDTIHVQGKRQRVQAAIEQKSRETINREMIRDNRDLVRYSTDVGVSENGRRSKGFAMRGVEGNRVGVNIDGVSLPDSEENSLYSRYGNFNNARLGIDSELVRTIKVDKGANSFLSGSGALGGSVNYQTVDAYDLLRPERTFGGLFRNGYASKNREWVNTLGLGFANDTVDAALLFSHRQGHELKSNRPKDLMPWVGYSETTKQRNAILGHARIDPDPAKTKVNSYLAKFGWQMTPAHRLALSLNGQNNHNKAEEYSYVYPTAIDGKYWRESDDQAKRFNTHLAYTYTPNDSKLHSLKTELDYQRTENGAINALGEYQYDDNTYAYTFEKSYLKELKNRNNKTKYKRLTFSAESQPLSLFGTQHQLSFKTFASQRHFENINNDRVLDEHGALAKTYGGQPNPDIYTIQRPIKTTQIGAALLDNITWNRIFSSVLGVRYDVEKVKPQQSSIHCGAYSALGDLCVGNPDDASFKNWSTLLGLNAQLNPQWQLGAQVSTGYRVPTASELYFSFESPFGDWKANPNLKAERSTNINLSLRGKGDWGEMGVNAYHTRYRHFLTEQESENEYWLDYCLKEPAHCASYGIKPKQYKPAQQMVNVDKAHISGLEWNSRFHLGQGGWQLLTNVGYSKGKLSGNPAVSMLSIQPLKAVLGVDYESPNGKWGIFNRLTFQAAKKAKDAQYGKLTEHCLEEEEEFDDWTGETFTKCVKSEKLIKAVDFPYLSKRFFTFDVFGYYRPTQNITLRAGVYNLFNRRYHTWDTLRGINITPSTINSVDKQGQGLNRYFATGRNYGVSLEYKF